MRFIILLLLLHAGLNTAFAQKVVIVGKADAVYFGKQIRLTKMLDFVSERETVLSVDTLEKPGFFTLETVIKTTTPLYIKVDNCQGILYAEPGKTYKIGFLKKDSAQIETLGNIVPVEILFMSGDSTDLNFLISVCDEEREVLLAREKGTAVNDQHPKDLKPDSVERKKNQQLALLRNIDSLEIKLRKRFKWVKNAYFDTYITYTFAKTKLPLLGKAAWTTYLQGKKTQYEHKEFMEFLCAFYESEMEHKLYADKVFSIINENEDCLKFKEYVKHNNYTPNDTLQELAAVIMLRLANSIKLFQKDRLCATISHAVGAYKYPRHKEMMKNLNYSFCRLIPGAEMKDLSFQDLNGKLRTMEEFKEKFVYLMFWRSDIIECEEQLRQIPELRKKYGAKIVFISVFLDTDPVKIKSLLKKYPQANWDMFIPANGSDLLEQFKVKAVPLYFLINPFQRLVLSPAPEPGLEIEKKFDEIKKKGNKAFMPGQKEN